MRFRLALIGTIVLIGLAASIGVPYPSFPLKGNITSAKVTRQSQLQTGARKDVVIISSPEDLKKIQKSLHMIWANFCGPIDSWEGYVGYPRYDIVLTFSDGTTKTLLFRKDHFADGGSIPPEFFDLIEKRLPALPSESK